MSRPASLLGGLLVLAIGFGLVFWALYLSLGSPPALQPVGVKEATGRANCIPGRRGDDLFIDGEKYYAAFDRIWGITSGTCDRAIRGTEVRFAWVDIQDGNSTKRLVLELREAKTGRLFGSTREQRIAELAATPRMGASEMVTLISQFVIGLATIVLAVRLIRNSGNGKHN